MVKEDWTVREMTALVRLCAGQRFTSFNLHSELQTSIPTAFRILKRFEGLGLAVSQREHVNPSISERVPRVFYTATTAAVDQLRELQLMLST